ncbi:MAG: ribosome-associated translation inhibitor RaiA [Oscillospiraceae bacterium]|nr:ribosome-associated translation inhibitor RaiA [Oscillospiraceae bacterium]
MNITTVARKCTAGPTFQAHAEKKLAKLARLLGPESDQADVKITATAQKNGMTVEVTVRFGGMVLRAEEGAQQINDALDSCVDVLVRQLRKNKTRLEKRNTVNKFDFSNIADEAEEDYDVVRQKRVCCKPVDVDEAILQMNLTGHQFYLFLNAETDHFNVVYRRNDGGYGLLVPERE